MSGSLQRLQQAGLVPDGVDDELAGLLDGLSEVEVDVLLGVGAKLALIGASGDGGDDVGGFGLNPQLPGKPLQPQGPLVGRPGLNRPPRPSVGFDDASHRGNLFF